MISVMEESENHRPK